MILHSCTVGAKGMSFGTTVSLVQSLLALSFFFLFFSSWGVSLPDIVAAKNPSKSPAASQSAEPLVLRLRHITFRLLSQPPLIVCHVVNSFPPMTQWERI